MLNAVTRTFLTRICKSRTCHLKIELLSYSPANLLRIGLRFKVVFHFLGRLPFLRSSSIFIRKVFLRTMDMDGDHLALPCPYFVLYGNNFFCYILIENIQTFIFVVSLSSHRSRGPCLPPHHQQQPVSLEFLELVPS